MKKQLLRGANFKENLTKQDLGEALLEIVVELQKDHAKLTGKKEMSKVVYAKPLKQLIGEICELDKEEKIELHRKDAKNKSRK